MYTPKKAQLDRDCAIIRQEAIDNIRTWTSTDLCVWYREHVPAFGYRRVGEILTEIAWVVMRNREKNKAILEDKLDYNLKVGRELVEIEAQLEDVFDAMDEFQNDDRKYLISLLDKFRDMLAGEEAEGESYAG